jgi:hypothetical protein
MHIEYVPRPDGMAHVKFMFRDGTPEAEDLFITYLLGRFPTPPKRTFEEERDGQNYRVMQYGQCVIQPALFDIEKHAALVNRLRESCAEELAAAAPTEGDHLLVLLSQTAVSLHDEVRLSWKDDRPGVEIDDAVLRERLLPRLEDASNPA